jgi:hypothetical protein
LFTAAGAEITPSQRREMRQKAFWLASILFSSLRDLCACGGENCLWVVLICKPL